MQVKSYIIGAVILAVYAVGMCVDVMAVDAAQYAEISLEMLRSKSFLQVHALGRDYLDKPPLLFWLSSLSFYLFGIGTFAYKLPSVMFAILGIYSTYRFALLFYTRQTAVLAALMLATTQALFLITNDVRTDTLLMGSVIFAIWRLAAYTENNKLRDLMWGCAGVGLALLSKGPIGLIAVGAALLPHALIKGKWRTLLKPGVLAGIGLTALMLVPMCIGLYEQFGAQGLRFYYWTQSFGRITGESEWNNHPDTFFLLHSTAWAFMPWTLFLLGGWISALIAIVRDRGSMREYASVSGFTLVLMALMLSHYQLPHYSFVVYPLGAVMAAGFYERLDRRTVFFKSLSVLQLLMLVAIVIVAVILQYCFKGTDTISMISLVVVFGGAIVFALRSGGSDFLIRTSAAIIIVFNLLMSAFYFPAIMRYQPGSDFGRYARAHTGPDTEYVTYQYLAGYEDVFYAQQAPPQDLWDSDSFKKQLTGKSKLIAETNENGLKDLQRAGVHLRVVDARLAYKVSSLTSTFLDPATRDAVCEKIYLIEADRDSQ
ncbi:MAG: glycosyltransferase family 39 protein [Bacteroidetes bacterium]|nr:glycosyltransferase family 39 protein [Bacteroidota bacterium]